MSLAIDEPGLSDLSNLTSRARHRAPAYSKDPRVFADIYAEEINIAIWQRTSSQALQNAVQEFMAANPRVEKTLSVSPDNAADRVSEATGGTAPAALTSDVAGLVDMFCYLFGLQRAGLRIATLTHAMCPRFHVDRVPCRLITTYYGMATEWLPHSAIDRSRLGNGAGGLPDDKSGLYQDQRDIQRLKGGDVALLKGELWTGNENAGLVHRSPAILPGEKRLLLTLDVAE